MAQKQQQGTFGKIVRLFFSGFFFCIAAGLYGVSKWYTKTFNIEFKEFLLTIASPLKGTSPATVSEVVSACKTPLLTAGVIYLILAVIAFHKNVIFRKILSVFCAVVFVASALNMVNVFGLPSYLSLLTQSTAIYEKYYVDPADVSIRNGGEKKNLVYIYLESMESTYASRADGGAQPENNYIPRLTQLANENISFSNDENLGGFRSVSGTAWTMGALVGSTSGIPFSIAVLGQNSQNAMGERQKILSGLTTLGDILESEGYRQEFLCGSDGNFAGREQYFGSHGNYEVYDLDVARANGDLPSADYYDGFWGFEDFRLYDIAKKELTELASGDQPFNFTMLTVDTHHINGHLCERCTDTYEGQLERVLDCTDRQISAFIEWIRQQDFYKNTVIVVTGDHPRMDNTLTVDVDPEFERTIYNCFLNVNTATDSLLLQNRTWTCLDLFPTVLAAMGYTIEGDRLGLGTNLFSGKQTLAEELGFDALNLEFDKYSEYYLKHFL